MAVAETPLTEFAVYSPRPTLRVDDQEFPLVSELIVGLEVVEQEGGMSALELHLNNLASNSQNDADLAFERGDLLKLGSTISVYLGDQSAPREVFRGLITGLELLFGPNGAPDLVVLAEDAFQLARMQRRSLVHDKLTIKGLAEKLASGLSLKPVVDGFTTQIGPQVQLNESDLAFLRRLLVRYDGDLQVVGQELHVSPRGAVSRGTLDLEVHGQLRRARLLVDLAHQVTEVTVGGWNPARGERVKAKSTGAHLGAVKGLTGAKLLSSAIGPRSEHVAHLAVTTAEEAQALADAAFDKRARRLVSLEATVEGNPSVRVGTHLNLTGLSNRFDNTYYVVRACHRYGASGYETDFQAECAYWREN
jgi:phage protein D